MATDDWGKFKQAIFSPGKKNKLATEYMANKPTTLLHNTTRRSYLQGSHRA